MIPVLTEEELPRGKMILICRRLSDGELMACMIDPDHSNIIHENCIKALNNVMVYGCHVDEKEIQEILNK